MRGYFRSRDEFSRLTWLLGLYALFVGILPVVNIVSSKLTSLNIGMLTLTYSVGAFGYALTFPCTDVISELWGKKHAAVTVWAGLFTQVGSMTYVYVAISFPAAACWKNQAAFEQALSPVGRIVLASLVSYSISQRFDIAVFHSVRKLTGVDYLWTRIVCSTFLSQALDTTVFITAAFLGTEFIPWGEWSLLGTVIACQWLIKAMLTLIILPVCYFLRWKIGYSNRECLPDEEWKAAHE